MKSKIVLMLSVFGFTSTSLFVLSCKKDPVNLRSVEYTLPAEGTSGVTGKLLISENKDASFNIKVSLSKSRQDTVHLVKLYNGRVNAPGILAHDLFTIKGTGGQVSGQLNNIKQIKAPNNTMKNVTYDSIIAYNAFAKVHFSAFKSDSILCMGNVGK